MILLVGLYTTPIPAVRVGYKTDTYYSAANIDAASVATTKTAKNEKNNLRKVE